MMRYKTYKEIHTHLAEIEKYAGCAENFETKEPLYYNFANPLVAIDELLKPPYYIRVWWWFKAKLKPTNEIPF